MAKDDIIKHQFEKGKSGNPNGRPRKYVSLLVDQGYKKSEITNAIQSLMAMTLKELEAVFKNEDATILERTIAKAMKKSLDNGSLSSIETLITRLHGQPKHSTDITSNGEQITVPHIVFTNAD